LTPDLWRRLERINDEVNQTVVHRTDLEMWGKEEVWSYPEGFGDTEDFVLEKRRRLIADGVAPSGLLITVARLPNGDGQAVLTAHTNQGDFILDDIEPKILSWEQTKYVYLKRQSPHHSGVWLTITNSLGSTK